MHIKMCRYVNTLLKQHKQNGAPRQELTLTPLVISYAHTTSCAPTVLSAPLTSLSFLWTFFSMTSRASSFLLWWCEDICSFPFLTHLSLLLEVWELGAGSWGRSRSLCPLGNNAVCLCHREKELDPGCAPWVLEQAPLVLLSPAWGSSSSTPYFIY